MIQFFPSHAFLLVSVQAVLSPLCIQTLHESDPAQNAHQARLPSHGQIQHWPGCVCDRAPVDLTRADRKREMSVTTCIWCRTVPKCSAQEETGHFTFPHVLEVYRGESCKSLYLSFNWQVFSVITEHLVLLFLSFSFSNTCKHKLPKLLVLDKMMFYVLLYFSQWCLQIYTDGFHSSKGKIEIYTSNIYPRILGMFLFHRFFCHNNVTKGKYCISFQYHVKQHLCNSWKFG